MAHKHFEEHSCSCGCETTEKPHSVFTVGFFVSSAGFVCFLAAHIPDKLGGADLWYIYIAAYLLTGYEVLWGCLKDIVRGRIFTENFLMTLASAAALALGDYTEAVAVMLLYKIGQFFLSAAVRKSRAALDEEGQKKATNPSGMENFISKFAKIYTPVILIAAVVFAAVLPFAKDAPFSETLPEVLPFLVLACPCGIVISVPLACFAGSRSGRSAAVIKRVSIENIVFILLVKFSLLIAGLVISLPLFLAVFGDAGVTLLATLNSMRLLKRQTTKEVKN